MKLIIEIVEDDKKNLKINMNSDPNDNMCTQGEHIIVHAIAEHVRSLIQKTVIETKGSMVHARRTEA